MTPPEHILKEIYFQKSQRNRSYSLRAFARDLGVSHGYVSLILNDKRRVHPRLAADFASKLKLSQPDTDRLVESAKSGFWKAKGSTPSSPKRGADFFALELDRFKVLSEWYHLALLDLTMVPDFKPSYGWVARSLGIKPSQAKAAVGRLARLGLLEVSSDGWKKTHAMLTIPASVPSSAIRKFHQQMIGKALQELDSGEPEDFENRFIVGTTMAIDKSRLPEAKRRVAKFRRSLLKFLCDGTATDLYQMNLQLFPLVKKKKGTKNAR
jgi:uncharacterized protein (TIGR02147 family)